MKKFTFLTVTLCANVTLGCTTHHHTHNHYQQPAKIGIASSAQGTSGKVAAQAAKAQRKQSILAQQQGTSAGLKGDAGQQRFSGAASNNSPKSSGTATNLPQYEKETSHSLDVPFLKRLILEAFKLCIAARCGFKS